MYQLLAGQTLGMEKGNNRLEQNVCNLISCVGKLVGFMYVVFFMFVSLPFVFRQKTLPFRVYVMLALPPLDKKNVELKLFCTIHVVLSKIGAKYFFP